MYRSMGSVNFIIGDVVDGGYHIRLLDIECGCIEYKLVLTWSLNSILLDRIAYIS